MGLSIEAYRIADIVDGKAVCYDYDVIKDMELLKTISVLHGNGVLLDIVNTRYMGDMPCPSHLTFPATYRGDPVLAIYGHLAYRCDDGDSDWMEDNYDISSVTIPEGVMIVSSDLCSDCPGLRNINYPRSLLKR